MGSLGLLLCSGLGLQGDGCIPEVSAQERLCVPLQLSAAEHQSLPSLRTGLLDPAYLDTLRDVNGSTYLQAAAAGGAGRLGLAGCR